MRELIIDSFAGGGGASTGIEMALGVSPDIAINHDDTALAMHAANHPDTLHLPHNIWKVDPTAVCKGRPVGLLWTSPDCKHFSKAKGGRPVEKRIRDLAWVVVRWARQVSPRVIILENVEEFATWGPLGDDGRPCPERKGKTFKRWVGELRRLGYVVEWREMRACDYGAPTIRKRLFLIARRDGEPIVWPKPSHGDPKSDDVKAGRLKPWHTAAEIIDWSLPCPSIFDTADEIMAKHGLRAVRPLQEATLARIAKGVKRYVLDAAKPFIVPITHVGDARTYAIDEPLRTITTASRGEQALVTPFVTGVGGRMSQTDPRGIDQPAQTLTAKADSVIVTPFLAPRHNTAEAHYEPRTRPADKPLATVTAKGNSGVLVAPHLTKFRSNSVGSDIQRPVPTVTANSFVKRPGGAAPIGIVAPHLMTMRNAGKPVQGADQPTHTITAGGAHMHLVAAFMAQHNYLEPGHDAREPVSTIVGRGSTQGVVAANLSHLYGSGAGEGDPETPARTVSAEGQHHALVASFLSKYYGPAIGQAADTPLHTATVKPRFGLVSVSIDGEPFCLTDIGLRMLTPRELFSAQAFPPTYKIAATADGTPISKTDQVRMCGNSVPPVMACALAGANFAPRDVEPVANDDFFLEAAE